MPSPAKDIHKTTIHRAGWIIADSQTIIPNGYLVTAKGRIQAVGTGKPPLQKGTVIDHGPGVLLPPLVNTHTHLELCAFKDQIPTDKGFTHWIRGLLALREVTSRAQLLDGIKQGVQQLLDSGTLIIGDISSLGLSWNLLKASSLAGVLFKEYLGALLPSDWKLEKSGHFTQAFAGHAPHTTAPKLLKELFSANQDAKVPSSIHLAESVDEVEFLTTGQGQWAELLTQRRISFQDWPIPAESPVEYLQSLNLLRPGTLAVHLLQCQDKDFKNLADNSVSVSVCPTSNLNLHGQYPDVPAMLKAGLSVSLGTDSLASCNSLSIFDEMAVLSNHFPNIAPDKIFAMATANGAAALGLSHLYGTLSSGKQALMLYQPIFENRKETVFDQLANRPATVPEIIDER